MYVLEHFKLLFRHSQHLSKCLISTASLDSISKRTVNCKNKFRQKGEKIVLMSKVIKGDTLLDASSSVQMLYHCLATL